MLVELQVRAPDLSGGPWFKPRLAQAK
jgi:hypothetical protein